MRGNLLAVWGGGQVARGVVQGMPLLIKGEEYNCDLYLFVQSLLVEGDPVQFHAVKLQPCGFVAPFLGSSSIALSP
jgi:hypothetical protein